MNDGKELGKSPEQNTEKKTNKGKRWSQSDWSCKRQKDYGEIVTENKVKYPLPEIGTYVYVRVNHVFFKRQGKDKIVKCSYKLDDRCVDAWGAPIVYKVVEYKYGKNDPLKKGNAMLLEGRRNGGHNTYRLTLDTIRVAIGYYYLEVRPNDRQIYKNIKCNADNSPISELTSRCLKKLNALSGEIADDEE